MRLFISGLLFVFLVSAAQSALACNEEVYTPELSGASMASAMGAALESGDNVLFSWRLNSKGSFFAYHRFSSTPAEACTVSLWAKSVVNENVGSLRRIAVKRNVRGRAVQFKARKLPGMARVKSGDRYYDPIVNLATRSTCGGEVTVSSSPAARYANCGYRSRKVSSSKWLTYLKREL
jgi:hypothetical protein